jgi:hypothetical protein
MTKEVIVENDHNPPVWSTAISIEHLFQNNAIMVSWSDLPLYWYHFEAY